MKLFRKTLSVLLAALLLGCTALVAFAADGDITVSLRVEGITENLYYGDVTVAAGATALDALKAADAASDTLTISVSESQYGTYLNGINGVFAGSQTEKGWDGWMFRVNDAAVSVGIDAYTVSDGDAVVVYYSDEFGDTGMAYPVADLSALSEGKISFTTVVTEYDENWNPTEKTVALKGYTLIWDGAKIAADADGVVTIPADKLTAGEHSVQIESYAENGLPLVLRFAPDFTVTVEAAESDGDAEGELNFFQKIINFFKDLIQKIKDFFGKLFNK